MAGDAVGLMEALGIDRADVSGGSMESMIAPSKMALDQTKKHFFPRLDLFAHDYFIHCIS
jgi:hypothetical protein